MGPITQGSLDNVIIRCCVLLISATVKKGVSRVGVKALATSGIRSLIWACLTGGTESHAYVPSLRELRKVCFSSFYTGEVEITNRKSSNQKMCLKGVEQQDGMANTHYIEDSKKVIFAMRARRRK